MQQGLSTIKVKKQINAVASNLNYRDQKDHGEIDLKVGNGVMVALAVNTPELVYKIYTKAIELSLCVDCKGVGESYFGAVSD